ncbi:MAG: hypothetical protein H7336_10240 [Bacteriovorax sp.]|nr:hypothetical protein [Bacteriovorax sp.]
MRTISIIAFTSFLLLWGVYFFLKSDDKKDTALESANTEVLEKALSKDGTILSNKRRRDLDKIGSVINEDNVKIDEDTKEEIKTAKTAYNAKEGVKELQAMLEQSYLDRASTVKDIKRIQGEISERKNKMKQDVTNTEKWDPRFVYYLMIQENYSYAEINLIKSLAENGLNMEEIEYINELVRENSFMDRIMAFKQQGEVNRAVASFKKPKKKEVDDFIDDVKNGPGIEDKLIEMNYNKDEKEEMIYGNNQ